MAITTLARFATGEDARRAASALMSQDFERDRIGVLMTESTHRALPVRVEEDHAEEGVLAGGAAGILLGTVMGAVTGPPGFVLGGALATLWGALTGGAAGSLVGLLVGSGMSREDAVVLEERLRFGEVIVTVTNSDPTRASVAETTLRNTGALGPVRSFTV